MVDTPDTPLPRVALLGHDAYTTMVSSAGSGFSRHGDVAVNRWRNDGTRDNYGQWCYVNDLSSGAVWSAGHQPVCAAASSYLVTMAPERVTIHRRDGSFETRTDIVVVPGSAAESRRVIVTNTSEVDAEIEVTSYQEIVLAMPVLDRGHRAFSNLFVQTEWLPRAGSILAMRRPRSKEVKPGWGGHSIAVESGAGSISSETDRSKFIGRGRTSRNPVAMDNPGDLSCSAGAVLDPVFALRARLSIPAGESKQVIFTTFVANDHDDAGGLAASFHDFATAAKAFDPAEGDGNSSKGPAPSEAALYQDLAGVLLYGVRPAGSLPNNLQSLSTRTDLLDLGLTGEWPIVLATVASRENVDRVIELLDMHRYWSTRGIGADLVILCSAGADDRQLHDDIVSIVAASDWSSVLDRPQGVFVRATDSLREQDTALLESIARIRVDCTRDTLIGAAGV